MARPIYFLPCRRPFRGRSGMKLLCLGAVVGAFGEESGAVGSSSRPCVESTVVAGLPVGVRAARGAVAAAVVITKVEETASRPATNVVEAELAALD